MDKDESRWMEEYHSRLIEQLTEICRAHRMLAEDFPESQDIADKWREWAPEYIADALKEVNAYPMAAFAWPSYIGMAAARWWDEDWDRYRLREYSSLKGKGGWDDMDEHIQKNLLDIDLESRYAGQIADTLRACAEMCMDSIRKEEVEHQTEKAFYVMAQSFKAMFRIGAAIWLHRCGYRYERLAQPDMVS